MTVAVVLVALTVMADEKKSDLDEKALAIVKQVGELHKNAKSMHTEGVFASDVEDDNGKRHIKVEAVIDVEKPNRFAIRTRQDGDAKAGPDVVCDGKKLYAHAKKLKQYTEVEAANMPAIARALLQFGHANVGILFQNVLADNPYDALMEGVTKCTYAGKDKVDGEEAHHLKFEQPNLNWELWVATGDKPYVLKVFSVLEGDSGGKVSTVETYRNWIVDAAPAKDAFGFTPDAEAKKVKQIQASKRLGPPNAEVRARATFIS
jgi:hypothetical protein